MTQYTNLKIPQRRFNLRKWYESEAKQLADRFNRRELTAIEYSDQIQSLMDAYREMEKERR